MALFTNDDEFDIQVRGDKVIIDGITHDRTTIQVVLSPHSMNIHTLSDGCYRLEGKIYLTNDPVSHDIEDDIKYFTYCTESLNITTANIERLLKIQNTYRSYYFTTRLAFDGKILSLFKLRARL